MGRSKTSVLVLRTSPPKPYCIYQVEFYSLNIFHQLILNSAEQKFIRNISICIRQI